MRLKHLQLQGYKTFATKTEFLFPSGITAIVGPNGSGKSNIADAIRWVLGEQSYSLLRGKRSEDMIFSGSQSRPRAGMAEVILTLDNSDNWLPVEFNEVTVSRRAFRDGQNEYLINSNRVRLRDIMELLSQSGLSRRTYTIIGQGVVDSVLSLRAQERRELFEEAAGIAHYQNQRADALRRLDETQRNLQRVHDILAEIEPRLERLQRQAERAQEYGSLSGHLEELLRAWYGYQWGQAASALAQAQRVARRRSEQHEKRLQELQSLTERIDRTRQKQSQLRNQLGEWRRKSSELHTNAEGAQRELAVLNERRRQLSAQKEEHLALLATLDARLRAQSERVNQAQTAFEAAQQTLKTRERETEIAQAALENRVSTREKLVQARDSSRERQSSLRAALAARQSRLEVLIERIEALEGLTHANQVELGRLNDDLDKHVDRTARIEARLSQLLPERDRIRETCEELASERQELIEQLNGQRARLRHLREKEAQVAAQFELLSRLRSGFSIYGEAARSLLNFQGNDPRAGGESTRAFPGILGVLAQMVQLPNEDSTDVSRAVEAALGATASAIVVVNWRSAAEALRYLHSNGVPGRVIFLAIEPPSGQAVPGDSKAKEGFPSLAAKIHCEVRLRPLVNRLLGRAFLVPDLETAHANLLQLPANGFCVTREGEVLRPDGTIEGGQPARSTSPLAQEQDWKELGARRVELGERRETFEATVKQTGSALANIQRQIKQSNINLDDLNARLTIARTVRDQVKRQTDRLQQELVWRRSQIASAEKEQRDLEQRRYELAAEIGQLNDALRQAGAESSEIASKLQSLPTDEFADQLTAAQIASAAARQVCQSKEAILDELENARNQLNLERETRLTRVTALTDEEEQVAVRIAQVTKDEREITASLEAIAAELEPTETQLKKLDHEEQELEATERVERARFREFEGYLTAARLDLQRREDQLTQLRNRIEEDLGLVQFELGSSLQGQTPLPLHPIVSELPVVQRLPEGLEDEIKRLRAQLRRLEPVNPDAPADYQETRQRHSFLQEQSSDLTAAIDSLQQVISEMDGLIEHAFRQTFEAVATEFSRIFNILFDGGQARLELTDPEDLTLTGVEIVAQPPGKRLQALASLSGGERALTAVALIFAILKVSPTPFCILDEVDAMLDEANIGRFRATLESLAALTQFVIITHNRGTIPAADTVYGISMGADSVSQVFSIRLEGEQIKET